MNFENIESDRFLLRVLTSDLVSDEYLSWFNDSNVKRFITYSEETVTLDGLKKFVQEKFESTEALFFGIFLKSDKKIHIGNIKFEPICLDAGTAVMGILIGNTEWRGKSVFSEVSLVTDEVLRKLDIKKIYLAVSRDNVSAVGAYIKSGYFEDKENFLALDPIQSMCMIKIIEN